MKDELEISGAGDAGSDAAATAAAPPAAVLRAAAAADAAACAAGGPGGPGGAVSAADDGGGVGVGSLAEELTDLGGLAVEVAAERWPWVREVWGQSVPAIAQAAAAVCRKHGWLQGGVSGGPEVALVFALIGPTMATVKMVRAGSDDNVGAQE